MRLRILRFVTCVFLSLLLSNGIAYAQDSIAVGHHPFSLEAFVETYFNHDFSRPDNHQRPAFLYSHNRAGEININLAYLKGSYEAKRVRANLALAAGTYMNANYAAEPATLRYLMEANMGIKLSRKQKLWLDMGVLPSHLGFESAVSLDCWTPGRSLAAENSPYFETGMRLRYENHPGTWAFSVLALNGWQNITRIPGNSSISWGMQVQYKPSSRWTVNYSNFMGSVYPDSARRLRVFHDVYAQYQMDRWGLIAGFDIGNEEAVDPDDVWNTWFTPQVILRFAPSATWAFAARAEYFSDPQNVIAATPPNARFRCTGLSFNADYSPMSNASIRLEYRYLQNQDAIFEQDNALQRQNHSVLLSLALRLK